MIIFSYIVALITTGFIAKKATEAVKSSLKQQPVRVRVKSIRHR